MIIPSLAQNFNFKGATINAVVMSDTHGHLEHTDNCYQTMLKYKLFEPQQQGKINFLITGGDWFISGGKKGFKSDPKKSLAEYQLEMFNKLVSQIKRKYGEIRSLFVIGNHEMDGGVCKFIKTAKNLDAQIVASNLDFENSPAARELICEDKIVRFALDFVQDDKDPKTSYPILNVGISPINMRFYQNNLKGMKFIEEAKGHAPLTTFDTLRFVKKQIEQFKIQYPQGVVILTSHTGLNFAADCATIAPIDIIFDAHEHKDEINFVNNTPIVSLSMDFQKLVNAKIKIGDEGFVKGINIASYNPALEKDLPKGEISDFYEKLFGKDYKKTHILKASNPAVKKLGVEGVRYQNSHLANFICDSILSEIKEIDPSVDIFALNASSIRGGFELEGAPNVSHLDILNCLDGIRYDQADIYTTDIKGSELAYIVLDNFLFNKLNEERNPLIQYSGISINKYEMLKNYKHMLTDELCRYITLEATGERIDPDKTYRIANPEKYFIKTRNEDIKELWKRSKPLGANVLDLFSRFFEKREGKKILAKIRNRIV